MQISMETAVTTIASAKEVVIDPIRLFWSRTNSHHLKPNFCGMIAGSSYLSAKASIHRFISGTEKKKRNAAKKMYCKKFLFPINAEYHILTDEIITFIKGKGLGCSAWTVNDEKELKRLMIRKAENITTRNLKGAILVKKEMEL